MSNETKQSSVEYYAQQLQILADDVFKIGLTLDEYRIKKHELLEQAKEMEKDRIIEAWKKGDGLFDKVSDKMSFEYYNETYGNEKQ